MLTTKSKYLSLGLLLLSAILVSNCNKAQKPPLKIDPAFTGYVAAFTSGLIVNESPIRIRLMEEIANVDLDKPVADALFRFTPEISGKAYWVDNKTIEFRPEKRLPSGKLYDAEFYLSKVKDVPASLQTLRFQFETMRQAIFVYFEGIKTYNVNDLKWQKVLGKLQTADVAGDEQVEQAFAALQNGKAMRVTWDHAGDGKMHGFTVDSVLRTDDPQQLVLQWKGAPVGIDENGEKVIDIPPLGDFKVVEVNIIQQPDQYIEIFFSDPLKDGQDLIGLITLSSGAEVKLVVNENQVKMYPVSRQTGSMDVIAEQAVRNSGGYQLKEKFSRTITFTSIQPDLQLVGNGVILPNTNGLIFPFKAVNLNAVNVRIVKIFGDNIAQFLQVNQLDGSREMKRVGRLVHQSEIPLKAGKAIDYGSWNTFSLDLSKMIQAEPGAIYRVQVSFSKKHSLYPCDDSDAQEDEPEIPDFNSEESYDRPDNYYNYYDDFDDEYYGYRYCGRFNWDEKDNPCKTSYYLTNEHFITRNVLASNLGIIAKGGNSDTLLVAVTDIKTTNTLSGVEVEAYNFQEQLIGRQTTNANGFALLHLDKKPFLLIAKQGNQRGYLRVDDASSLSLSMFDVGGQQNKEGVKGFIYGERGVWRPGDSLYLSFILEDRNKVIPASHPVVLELYTPENQLYERKVKTSSLNKFYDFRTATDPNAPTGNWLAKVKVGGSAFTKTIRIETVKPNRLKINLDFHADIIRNTDTSRGDLEVKWLHGTVAKDLKADVVVTMSEGKTSFKDYPGFVFDDPSKKFESEEEKIFDGRLDAKGKAVVKPEFAVDANAPGMLNASFVVRAFEQGGDFSVDRFTIPYSSYRGYAGLKIPEGEGWNGALYSNEPNVIPIVTVDENGKPVDRKNVKIEIYNVSWRWWWDRSSEDDLARYIANNYASKIKTDYVNTVNGKAMYEMKFDSEYWGRRFVKVTDTETGHSAGQVFYVTYKGWWNNADDDNPGGAEMLTFTTDKNSYNVGEEVKINLPATNEGKALVSIESGSKVIQSFWVNVTTGSHQCSFKTTRAMSPNVYVNISLIQPHSRVNNDLPIRLYGVQSVSVEDAQTHLAPVLKMPDELAPEQNATIKISEQSGRKMTYTVAVVDDGLLDLTRFQTPDPWNNFYACEALGVKTWDMYKYVIGAFSGELAGLLALGGDESAGKKGSQKANRFKPVVVFLGPFELQEGKENTHTFRMPNYVGSVRTMVVAGYEGAYGFAEKTTSVKKPLMVLATLPRVVGPAETVKLPVTVFAMDKKIKDVTVEIQPNKLLIPQGGTQKKISFAEPGDQVVNFDLKVAEQIGIGKVKITATSGNEKAVHEIELDVRLPNPRVTDVISGVVEAGKTWETDYKPVGMAGTNNGMVEVSKLPPINLEKRLQYLIQYPHGCIEQTTSSVFPQLFVSKLLDLSPGQKAQIDNNIAAGITRMRSFQISNGGLSYWPGESGEASEWGSNYAGHFMLEAQASGYQLPYDFLKNWVKYQTQMANSWTGGGEGTRLHHYNSDELTQAYRLYTLALAQKPALGAMNRMREMKNLSNTARWRLAAAYYLAGKYEVAESLVENITAKVEPYKELDYSFGSDDRDEAMILETLSLMKKMRLAKEVLDEIARSLGSDTWYSTQTTAYCLMAIAKFVGASGTQSDMVYEYHHDGVKEGDVSTKAPISQRKLEIIDARIGKIKITNKSDQTIFVKVQLDGIPLTGDPTNVENDLKMKVRYLDLNGGEINPGMLEQGSDFMAEVSVSHPGARMDYKNMALVQIFPSGWEIRNTRMDEAQSVHIKDIPRYQDIRDDRVYSYFDINKNNSKTYRVLLNAAYMGKFYLPTVYCEAMYDNEINARRAGRWVEVVEAGSTVANAGTE